ncbi:MAG: S46 family peptidase [Gemmatimonadetes bacterium]|nr:S46 family peptidase [Gemmatimonadota bacterium]
MLGFYGFRGRAARLALSFAVTLPMLAIAPQSASAQMGGVNLDTIQAGRFDYGKMWTFEYAPADYFSETYGFDANPEWFERARLSVLRIPGCSASFVSPHGLVATNHHCVRGRVAGLSGEGEDLLSTGFVARTLTDERRIPGYYADQLIQVQDISDRVFAVTDAASDEDRDAARSQVVEEIQTQLKAEHASGGDSIWVQVIGLYNGGRYSAYVFRRFTDVRLVVAAEVEMGFFGGDPDNFTYPRYDLDFSFLRVYEDDRPYQTQHYFGWGDGVESGDAVFIIGNPGQTNRLKTIAQLEYQRDVSVPANVHFLGTRLGVLADFRKADPEGARELGLRNWMFGLSNSLKANTGRLEALNNPMIMARKADAERKLAEAIAADPTLRTAYGGVFDRLAAIQVQKREFAAYSGAFQGMGGTFAGSITMARAMRAQTVLNAIADGESEEEMEQLMAELRRVRDRAPEVEVGFLAHRLADFERYLGADHPVTQAALGELDPEAAARAMLESSVLDSGEATLAAIEAGTLGVDDPVIALMAELFPLTSEFRRTSGALGSEESDLQAALGRVRFEVYGSEIPPDGSFSPRIADGVVKGYPYNGTLAPPYTTFYGLYDRYFGHGEGVGIGEEWSLPERWQTPPEGLDLSTPLNFISTTDSYGGNSGSPAVTPDLELVGLNFDRNINGLSRDFIYLPEQGRNVMVDVRAIRAALDVVYDADRVVAEMVGGMLYETEEEADAAAM